MSKTFLVLFMLTSAASATEYPSVKEMERGLGYSPGIQLPRDIPARGKGWHVFYVRAKAVGDGEYDVRIKLR